MASTSELERVQVAVSYYFASLSTPWQARIVVSSRFPESMHKTLLVCTTRVMTADIRHTGGVNLTHINFCSSSISRGQFSSCLFGAPSILEGPRRGLAPSLIP